MIWSMEPPVASAIGSKNASMMTARREDRVHLQMGALSRLQSVVQVRRTSRLTATNERGDPGGRRGEIETAKQARQARFGARPPTATQTRITPRAPARPEWKAARARVYSPSRTCPRPSSTSRPNCLQAAFHAPPRTPGPRKDDRTDLYEKGSPCKWIGLCTTMSVRGASCSALAKLRTVRHVSSCRAFHSASRALCVPLCRARPHI